MAKRLLEEMTWPEAEAALAERRLAVVPVGSTEQHGRHLPLGTDTMSADALARRPSTGIEVGGIYSLRFRGARVGSVLRTRDASEAGNLGDDPRTATRERGEAIFRGARLSR